MWVQIPPGTICLSQCRSITDSVSETLPKVGAGRPGEVVAAQIQPGQFRPGTRITQFGGIRIIQTVPSQVQPDQSLHQRGMKQLGERTGPFSKARSRQGKLLQAAQVR